MKLNKDQKLLVLELASASSLTTARWRMFVPLSIKGLVDVDREAARSHSALWGVECASVSLTDRGRVCATEIDREVSLWHATAVAHHSREAIEGAGKPKRCPCACCSAAWRMRPEAA